MSGCLGSVLAALVDGELDHAAREKAHRHLAHCDVCRAEVEAQRRLKAHLARLAPAPPSPALLARLHALAQAPQEHEPAARLREAETAQPRQATASRARDRTPPPPLSPVVPRSSATAAPSTRPAPGRPAPRAAAARRRPPVLSRRAAAGSAFAVLGVATALALGAPPQRTPATPAGTAPVVLVTDVAGTSGGVSGGLLGGGLASVSAVRTATDTGAVRGRPEVPVRTAATTGGARPTR